MRRVTMTLAGAVMAVLGCASASLAFAGDREYPEFPVPDFVKTTMVADDVTYNGVPMRLMEFSSTKPEEALVDFYEAQWGDELRDVTMRPWRVLSHKNGEYLMTVQVTESNEMRVRGNLSIAPMFSGALKADKELGKGFPVMPGSKVLNDIRSNDGGKVSRTLVLGSNRSVRHHANYYRKRLEDMGWQESFHDVPSASDRLKDHNLVLTKGEQRLNMNFAETAGQTYTVAVLVHPE